MRGIGAVIVECLLVVILRRRLRLRMDELIREVQQMVSVVVSVVVAWLVQITPVLVVFIRQRGPGLKSELGIGQS